MQTGNTNLILKSELDKACFQRDMGNIQSKNLAKRRQSGNVLRYKAFEMPNANELHRQIIRRFKRGKVYSSFKDNIWGVNMTDMQSLSKYKKGINYLLCAIYFLSKYAWVVPLKDKRVTIVNAFQKILQ